MDGAWNNFYVHNNIAQISKEFWNIVHGTIVSPKMSTYKILHGVAAVDGSLAVWKKKFTGKLGCHTFIS